MDVTQDSQLKSAVRFCLGVFSLFFQLDDSTRSDQASEIKIVKWLEVGVVSS